MISVAPILFSGYNDRAVIALCRLFQAHQLEFYIITSREQDALYKTTWRKRVIYRRGTPELSIALFQQVANLVRSRGMRPLLCPTSEFLNQYVLENRESIESHGWKIPLPPAKLYYSLTNKWQSPELIEKLSGLSSPTSMPLNTCSAPCVLKPKQNVENGRTHHPILCKTEDELSRALATIDQERWFVQPWIEGQSYYLCAYIDIDGGWNSYWQENLIQQDAGKSIVLARTSASPGLDERRLLEGVAGLGYWGPFMLEVIQDSNGNLYFIEVNPRFWGPLELARRAHPEVLERYISDVANRERPPTGPLRAVSEHWYAWSYGAMQPHNRHYPRLLDISDPAHLKVLIDKNDVYAESDTCALHKSH